MEKFCVARILQILDEIENNELCCLFKKKPDCKVKKPKENCPPPKCC